MFTAHMHFDKIAEELLAETRSPLDAFKYSIRREKGTEHGRTLQTSPFGGPSTTPTVQEPVHYINSRSRGNYTNNLYPQIGRGGFRCRPYGTCRTQKKESTTTNLLQSTTKAMLKVRQTIRPKPLTVPPCKSQNLLKMRQRGPFCKSM